MRRTHDVFLAALVHFKIRMCIEQEEIEGDREKIGLGRMSRENDSQTGRHR